MERTGHTNAKSARRHSHIWRQWISCHADICLLMSLQYSGLLTSYLVKSIVNWRDRLLLTALAPVLAQGNT